MTDPITTERGERLAADRQQTLAEQAAQGYAQGLSIRQLAERHNRSYGAMNRLLKDHGVELRGRGGANRRPAAAADA